MVLIINMVIDTIMWAFSPRGDAEVKFIVLKPLIKRINRRLLA